MLRKVLSYVLLIILLVQNTGVTLIHHYCNMAGSREIVAFDGVAEDACSDCCCDVPEPGDFPLKEQNPSFEAPSCCYEITTYLKFNYTSTLATPLLFQPLADLAWNYQEMPEAPLTDSNLCHSHPFYQFYSPPLTGIALLHAIHQIKIPAWSSRS